jgi:DNA (cytosine-5)-methyltransferase 1
VPEHDRSAVPSGRVVELFAGVGGFRLGLEGHPRAAGRGRQWDVVWSNQYEPSTPTVQHASSVYERWWDDGGHVNEDIHNVLRRDLLGEPIGNRSAAPLPEDFDLLVGGFPCQDYSVAKPLSMSRGLKGEKGVLWWRIYDILRERKPQFVLLENVDRLLKSPTKARGRDFAIILSCFHRLGYTVEWRVINAADYGFPQRRYRAFIYAELDRPPIDVERDGAAHVLNNGVLTARLPAELDRSKGTFTRPIGADPHEITRNFGNDLEDRKWGAAGLMSDGRVWHGHLNAIYKGPHRYLGDVLLPDEQVPNEYFIDPDRLGEPVDPAPGTWRYLKGAKREPRRHASGFTYSYAEGAMTFPDDLDRPSRTILTGEGGRSPSRFKHVVLAADGRHRRLVPEELELLSGFPAGWTELGARGERIAPGRRSFLMGNALVVGLVEQLGLAIADRRAELASQPPLRAAS